jgi:hypothetical protein
MKQRRCAVCQRPITGRATAKYCSATCRVLHWRWCQRLAQRLARGARCATCHKRLPLTARVDQRYCSSACRQGAYRARKVAKPAKAHQRRVKDSLANDSDERAALDIGRAEARGRRASE